MKRAERFSSDSNWSEYGTLTRKKFDHSFSLQCTVSITVQTCPNRFVKGKKKVLCTHYDTRNVRRRAAHDTELFSH